MASRRKFVEFFVLLAALAARAQADDAVPVPECPSPAPRRGRAADA